MNLVEAKKLSDVVIDSTRFSEIVNQNATLYNEQNITINGNGKARVRTYTTNGWFTFYVDGQYVNRDVLMEYSGNNTVDRYPCIDFTKSLQVQYSTNGGSSATGVVDIVAYLHNNISIGGGYRRKLVPFSIRKAVAA